VSAYREAFDRHGRNEAALCWSKGKQAVRFAALCASIPDTHASLLDFGCGLGDLAAWLKIHRPRISYTGADALAEFIADNARNSPHTRFLTVGGAQDITETYDHIVCCGVFNLDPDDDSRHHWGYIRDSLTHLFKKTRVSLHVDFLAHDTDYRQPGAHHQNAAELINFIETGLNRRYVLDRSYMPYEYCVSIFADRTIDPARNIYHAR
jgi:hypothetical protein